MCTTKNPTTQNKPTVNASTYETISFTNQKNHTLKGSLFKSEHSQAVIIINGATAVPQQFYRRFAEFIQQQGVTALTYDFSGIGESAPKNLKGCTVKCSDWGLFDIPAAVNWAQKTLQPEKIYLIGHSAGGQQAGLLEDSSMITAMATVSSQSGYWKLQGGKEKLNVFMQTHFILPILSHLVGYFPWRWFANSENLPKQVALQWSKWCRSKNYLLDDKSLPLERYKQFKAPVLAYSIEDDDWGTAASVDSLMLRAYSKVERRHILPNNYGIKRMGHMGFFRPEAEPLWHEIVEWLLKHS